MVPKATKKVNVRVRKGEEGGRKRDERRGGGKKIYDPRSVEA